jgi:hypothetical protein
MIENGTDISKMVEPTSMVVASARITTAEQAARAAILPSAAALK